MSVWKSSAIGALRTPQVGDRIGCGGGFMVGAFARLGARAIGLDINAAAIAYAHRHFPRCEFYCESLRDFRARGLHFDFVFSTEVFEHLAGPSEFMATLDAITKRGSRVYIATPDSGHAAVPADLSQWDQIQPPAHLQFFNREGLSVLFRRYGFVLEKAYRKRSPARSLVFRREAMSALKP
ncbi:MAG TPA: class I SAM-dependent methyltransferase [Stellaceae bacterium]|nr:class I SAM-dependent methyltransferase [Stellaceae bacterium]